LTVYRIDIERLDGLIRMLCAEGYECIAPQVRDGSAVCAAMSSAADLPRGWIDQHSAGSCRLIDTGGPQRFGIQPGVHHWKQVLLPETATLFHAVGGPDGFHPMTHRSALRKPLAFLGIRSCDLHAIDRLDRVYLRRDFRDPDYAARRKNLFTLAVHCTEPGGTCFCSATGTGPRVERGGDVCLTEIADKAEHFFVAEARSRYGKRLMGRLAAAPASAADRVRSAALLSRSAGAMPRTLPTPGLKEALYASIESERWQTAAAACLSCGSCTAVCPTCFCSDWIDHSDLAGESTARIWVRDSCFQLDFSYLHRGVVRASTLSRYRHFVLHKLATWHDQFGTSGCVGCGRCITWCPAGIDITATVQEITAISSAYPGCFHPIATSGMPAAWKRPVPSASMPAACGRSARPTTIWGTS
jgi:ferredoxin